MMTGRTLSPSGVRFICKWEGFRSRPYLCPAGVPTIGYGSTRYADGRVVSLSDPPITREEALTLKAETLPFYEDAVRRYVQVPLTQRAYDALVSFTYNLGPGALRRSTLLTLVNAGDRDGAAKEFPKWCRAGGKVLDGLRARRLAEKAMFES